MSLTKEDLTQIKNLLDSTLENRFKEFETGFEAKIDLKLDKLEKRMNARFDAIDIVLNDLVKFTTEDIMQMIGNHEGRISVLEKKCVS